MQLTLILRPSKVILWVLILVDQPLSDRIVGVGMWLQTLSPLTEVDSFFQKKRGNVKQLFSNFSESLESVNSIKYSVKHTRQLQPS